MAIKDFLSGLRSMPMDVAASNTRLAKLKGERQAVANTPPDAASARAWFKRRLANAERSATERLTRWHLNKDSFAKWSGSTFDSTPGFNVLGLTSTAPNHASPNPEGGHVDVDMLLWVLAPVIEQRLDAIFDQHVAPIVKAGMSTDKRNARLANLDAQIAKLEAERAELHANLEEARKHLAGEGHTAGPSDAAIAAEVAAYERETGERVTESN
jgi:hypothetical protein